MQWQFILTQKGTQRAKNLAKSVGLVVKIEVDLDESANLAGVKGNLQRSVNKITINMYDKDLMPIVDDLYLNDQAAGLLQMK